ncbi:hypothetical protein [Ralstonia phage phiRSL1]|uniref:Uncharacterized protein n=1 Tax=Ralstonia phage phiRSL1 TaxID=1980924 RepID=B2ZYG9_9CAUD|nr:peptidase [Ralstonia phage phiRSL1]BAG41696.1 hypothetical protein [Ralstonia phage phiRSL1]
MIQIQKGDYVFGQEADSKAKKPVLFKVSSISNGIVSGIIEKDPHLKQKRSVFECPVKKVILNAGPNPHPGKVHGWDLHSLYRGKKWHDQFGAIHFFYDITPENGKAMVSAFDRAYKVLKANRLDFIIQPDICVWEVLPANGEKYSGMYKRSKTPDRSPHRLQIKPETMPQTDWLYVIFHELAGHHLHYEFLTSRKLNAEWVKLFNTTISVKSVKKEDSQRLLDGLLAQEDPPSAYTANLSEEDTELYRLILKYIGQQHNVSVKELDLLFEAGYRDELKGVWPARGVQKKDLEPLVSEYACKNYKELIAESMAFKLTGKKLPKAVEALLERSLSYARKQHAPG